MTLGFVSRHRTGAAIVGAAALVAAGAVISTGSASAATTAAGTSSHAFTNRGHGYMPELANWKAAQKGARHASGTLTYGGGTAGVGVMDVQPKVYLVFYGSQWGTQGTDASGNLTFSNDPYNAAPVSQNLFKGIGTGGEQWSGTMTQYCDGAGVTKGATSCPAGASHVPYPTNGVYAGVWYDNTAASPAQATGNQLGVEALNAAHHFGNTTSAANRGAYYVILSPHGTNPDNYQSTTTGFCAWHDYNGDSTLTGGAVTSDVGNFAFSNQPYNMDAGANCGVNFINSGTSGTLDGWTMTLGHEYSETITDQFPAGGWTNPTNGQENADECAWLKTGTGAAGSVTMGNGTYTLQGSWSNDTNACALTHPTVG